MCSDGRVTSHTGEPRDDSATSLDPEVLRRIAVDIAREAGAHVRRRRPEVFGRGLFGQEVDVAADAVQSKSTPTDPVTVVDTETEHVIRDLLSRLRPDDAVLGEEGGGDSVAPSGVRWVLDPIDGTVNFLYGIPAYSVSVAAQIDGTSVAGAVEDVVGRRTYAASTGSGAWESEDGGEWKRLQANDIDDVALALVATGFGYDSARRRRQGAIIADLLPEVRDVRRIGSAALDLCMVAAGRVDAHFEHGLSPWDWAAGALIAAEAGARVITPSPHSRSDDGEVTVAVAAGVSEKFVELLVRLGGREAIPKG
ncbi:MULTISPECIES: inositol monophosphatase family protein [unclassified Rhodococcus (in: high G+C Gram-positive bacteria)]|uniref:inositol monophosphatase family protein n=1 Tax=unclassified Rhodococcus (in: high G+C Gram-positive bacteria) TaxID=192944 RepID=UPI0009EB57D8